MADHDLSAIETAECKSVLARYARALVHMRQQKQRGRFGLVFGAGATKPLGFPTWGELIERIAQDDAVKGEDLIAHRAQESSRSRLLYERFRSGLPAGAGTEDKYNRKELTARAGWQRVVHRALYRSVPKDIKDLLTKDPYLWAFREVIKETPLTVNYNFDNTLERMLADARTPEERLQTRGYVPVWNANIQLNSRKGVIYHPNGYLPHELSEKHSEHLVFLEDSFADQLIDSMAGHYTALANHYAQTTCLLIGLSLGDTSLKHLLRQNARGFPGHFHYYVAHVQDGDKRDPAYERAVSEANFHVYNLITLFLTGSEIESVGKLLAISELEFRAAAEEQGRESVFKYYITGSVSVGKTTMTTQLRSFAAHDEWTEPLPEAMNRDPSRVEGDVLNRIDQWVLDQIGKKNLLLDNERFGIHIVDRAPLDAFAFTPKAEWSNKAKKIRKAVSKDKAVERKLSPAHIILLIGDPEVMAARSILRLKDFSPSELRDQQELLREIYVKRLPSGVTIIDTTDKGIPQVVREVAYVVLLSEYAEADMDSCLTDLVTTNNEIIG